MAQISFICRIDKNGYKIVPPKRPPRQPGQGESDWVLNSPASEWVEARIVGLGGGQKTVNLRQYPMLFKEFANVRTPEQLLEFVTKYGPLRDNKKGDEIPQLLDAAKRMRTGRVELVVANLKARLTTVKGKVSIRTTAARLIDALWLQLGQAKADGAEWKECKGCGDWFVVGGNSGLRSVADFHSEDCRIKFNSLERTRRKRSRR